jgi:membrane-bound serine protease (ClpP class)
MNPADLLWQTLVNPNIVYVLLIAGLWCAALAITTPGIGIPEAGAVGFLSLALLGLIRLPINVVGLFLIILSLGLYVVELKWPSHGAFIITGIITLAIGSFFLFPANEGANQLSVALVIGTVLSTAAFFLLAMRLALAVRHKPLFQNPDAVVGTVGEAKTDILKDGAVQVGDELWTAEADELIVSGTRVQILRRNGLRLKVARLKPSA